MLCLLNFRPRWYSLIENIDVLRKYAIGYCPADDFICRPSKEIAVMFSINDVIGWFHLREEEFERIFNVG